MLDRIVTALAEVLVALELGTDDEIDPDYAASIQGEVVDVFDTMSDVDKAELAQLLDGLAVDEPDERRREVLAGLAEAYGLLDDE